MEKVCVDRGYNGKIGEWIIEEEPRSANGRGGCSSSL
jgi:hypothetical protein